MRRSGRPGGFDQGPVSTAGHPPAFRLRQEGDSRPLGLILTRLLDGGWKGRRFRPGKAENAAPPLPKSPSQIARRPRVPEERRCFKQVGAPPARRGEPRGRAVCQRGFGTAPARRRGPAMAPGPQHGPLRRQPPRAPRVKLRASSVIHGAAVRTGAPLSPNVFSGAVHVISSGRQQMHQRANNAFV